MLPDPVRTTLGADPTHRTCALNGYAFQQDALRSFNGWQYACFYSSLASAQEPLYVHLSRRKLPDGPWETIVFEDYAQTVDDGHNTVQLGICPGDGTIHLSYDHHCDELRYRYSKVGVATSPESTRWETSLFTTTQSTLPGLEKSEKVADLLSYITYPRFVTRGQDLLFTFRTGKAGLGDDHLCVYTAASPSPSSSHNTVEKTGEEQKVGTYSFLGTHLKGIWNNPYIHGLDASADGSRLYTTWVYREFVHYPGWDDPADTQHKQQAGPNSAANNRDICYAWSSDGGTRWHSGGSIDSDEVEVIADLERGESILPTSKGIVAFAIPKGSGLINQEAQAVDGEGGVHVLNRDNLDGGVQRWKHYYLSSHGAPWTQRALPHVDSVYGGKRGQIAVSRDGDLYFVLPHHTDPVLTILRASKANRYAEYELVWRGDGFPPTEPLVDKARLGDENVLSVFTRARTRSGGDVDVVVLDFQL
ncbi:hypothetical protein F5Y07DRAFT_396970 [Xylaria sp. FL0933]|nr:hypothetical protein F5Y07DRAFT_396970 [Xylaria sp. FL0933]